MIDQMTEGSGTIVVVSGPSGVGKTTICRAINERLDNVYLSASVTTREKSETEVDGRDYWFITKQQFQQRIEKGLLLEYAEVFGNLYGTPKDTTDQALQVGQTVVLDIDVQGARQVKAVYPKAVMIFILPPEQKDLIERISSRAREDAETAKVRLSKAESEIADARQLCQYMVVNDDLEQAIGEVIGIIQKSIGEKQKC